MLLTFNLTLNTSICKYNCSQCCCRVCQDYMMTSFLLTIMKSSCVLGMPIPVYCVPTHRVYWLCPLINIFVLPWACRQCTKQVRMSMQPVSFQLTWKLIVQYSPLQRLNHCFALEKKRFVIVSWEQLHHIMTSNVHVINPQPIHV